ncbi:MAG TPA: iron ABC transporter permease [Coriobacteriia bacterium]|nr:iron ABC transporter permease [Coriobacteriia bacterium]
MRRVRRVRVIRADGTRGQIGGRGAESVLPLLALCIAGLAVLPVGVVAASLLTPTYDVWRHLWDTILPRMMLNTALLLGGVAIGTLVLGTGLAWLVSAYEFPGRRMFRWLLVLPMAVPTYIMGFVFVAVLDSAGPVQSAVRDLGWVEAPFPEIRSGVGAVIVMTLVLYPYVYLLAKAGFDELSGSMFEAARALGANRRRRLLEVALPLARPSIAAGVGLASMEALADFATVRYFNFPTVSDGVLRVWFGMMDLGAASELAGVLALFTLALLLLERRTRRRRAYHQSKGKVPGVPVTRLSGWGAAGAAIACTATVAAAFGLPAVQLLVWGFAELGRATRGELATYAELALNSLALATLAAVCAALVALVFATLARLRSGAFSRLATGLVSIGYSMPGAVIGVGVLLPLAAFDRTVNRVLESSLGVTAGLILTGSLIGLAYAYTARFMAVAHGSIDASMEKIAPNTVLAARSLGAGPVRLGYQIKLPLILPGITAGAVLVFVDVMKELPITVMLRPFGYDTLAIWVWQMAAESLWASAAIPALAIVATGLIPVKLLLEASDAGAGRGSAQ